MQTVFKVWLKIACIWCIDKVSMHTKHWTFCVEFRSRTPTVYHSNILAFGFQRPFPRIFLWWWFKTKLQYFSFTFSDLVSPSFIYGSFLFIHWGDFKKKNTAVLQFASLLWRSAIKSSYIFWTLIKGQEEAWGNLVVF